MSSLEKKPLVPGKLKSSELLIWAFLSLALHLPFLFHYKVDEIASDAFVYHHVAKNFAEKNEFLSQTDVTKFSLNKERGHRLDIAAAKRYFTELYETTGYPICQKLLLKIDQIELSDFISTEGQQAFIRDHRDYLRMIEDYTAFEFELINRGRDVSDVKAEIEFLKKFDTKG